MLAASVPFEELATLDRQTAADLPESITLSSDTTESLSTLPAAGESGAARGNQKPQIFFGVDGEPIEVNQDVFGIATTESGDSPAFEATSAFSEIGAPSLFLFSGASDLGVDGEIALGNVLQGFTTTGSLLQVNDQTLLFTGSEESAQILDEFREATGSGIFSSEADVLPLDLFGAEEISSELADAALEGSIGGTTVTPEEIQNATIQGLAVLANELSGALFVGETGGQEDGTTTLTRVDPSLPANLVAASEASASPENDPDSDARADADRDSGRQSKTRNRERRARG